MSTRANHPLQKDFNGHAVRELATRMKQMDGPLLPILHAVNEQFGYVDERALPVIADVLNLTRAEVQGVVSFYHDFRRTPAGRHVVKICRAEACQAMGAERLIGDMETALGVKLGETRADGQITFEPVYCLGNCALSPAALIDGQLHGRLNAAAALALAGK
ncbi:MAG: formate dehydrogenase subunit gamma [Alphaproteobacteria bacterium]|nr:formate dehydrogenase subunit gamma [Alphaproteobacteria bacterium]